MKQYEDPIYIKMCEKAEEIQRLAPRPPIVSSGKERWNEYFNIQGSVFWLPKENEFALLHWDNDEGRYIIGGYYSNLEGMIWLPTQSQLQEIYWKERYDYIEKATDCEIKDLYFDMLKECYDLREWYIQEGYDYDHLHSFGQLWLAFVMKELYNKIWNGKEWVKE